MRPKLVFGNWKMHKTRAETAEWLRRVVAGLTSEIMPRAAAFVPFTVLAEAAALAAGTPLEIGAQNLFWENSGAFTGEISAPMIKDAGAGSVLIGHSERRQIAGENDRDINRKLHLALAEGLQPVLCVGETLEERERRETAIVLRRQLGVAVKGLPAEQAEQLVIAYEPVWAIGSGRAAAPADAEAAAALLRGALRELYPQGALADRVPVLYGGSVTPDNVRPYFELEQVDGVLAGGASLQPTGFLGLVAAARAAQLERGSAE